MKKKISIDPITRLEGHGKIEIFLDEEGQVQRIQVNESSGHRSFDNAALQVASTIEFTPALNRDQRRPVWVSLPIQFTTDDAAGPEGDQASPPGVGHKRHRTDSRAGSRTHTDGTAGPTACHTSHRNSYRVDYRNRT